MKTTEITEAELKQVQYMDNAIRNMKSPKQKLAIELKDRDKRLARREKLKVEIKSRLTPTVKKVWINSQMKKMTLDELTEDIIDAETHFII